MVAFTTPVVPVSWGELLDKMTILEIKRDRIRAPGALAHVGREYQLVGGIATAALERPDVARAVRLLRRINERLWEIEDAIRDEEAAARFGAAFIRLARSVYRMNDRRAAVKRRINMLLQSELVEEKCYAARTAVGGHG